jgi:hypothetical protein
LGIFFTNEKFTFISQNDKIAQGMKDVRFISAISDGSTDSSYQEAEIVFIRHCHNGEMQIQQFFIRAILRTYMQTF